MPIFYIFSTMPADELLMEGARFKSRQAIFACILRIFVLYMVIYEGGQLVSIK